MCVCGGGAVCTCACVVVVLCASNQAVQKESPSNLVEISSRAVGVVASRGQDDGALDRACVRLEVVCKQ